ncbi:MULTISPECIES: cupin-like domain-containing protein [Photorhabdus]|uniref:JmjC domain-containing protein n=1 Tax=Photorhabdus thracensis TaxID=230089 RepID=A0A0F7LTX8_9GAMM|nr:cupin-like domain-containing protein [Photorhabdus thracensis]AKH65232.1 hypothetical protein VY86_19625 [Photorhabdus thracensis]
MMLTSPILLKGVTLDWAAHWRWTWKFFSGMQEQKLALSNASGEFEVEVPVCEYIQALKSGEGKLASLYASGWRFFEQNSDMLKDFSEPVQVVDDLLQSIPEKLFKPLLWIFIGADCSGTALHYDALETHAWLAVIEGKKRLALHPPACWDHEYEQQRAQALQVLEKRCDKGVWYYLEVNKGDLLFIPATWWHEVANEGPTISLTRNFASPEIAHQVANCARTLEFHQLLPWLERKEIP